MATCYNIIYDNPTSAFVIHGGSLTDDSGIITHSCGFPVETSTSASANANLILSAGIALSTANTQLTNTTSATAVSSALVPDINTTVDEDVTEMKIELTITIKSPIIRTIFNPPKKVKKDGIVTR